MVGSNKTVRSEFYIRMGSFLAGSGPTDVMKTFVGSCVGLCLYDPVTKSGALGHVMHPDSNGNPPISDYDARYADHAVKSMVSAIEKKGGSRTRLVARMAGGATLFLPEGKCNEFLFNIGIRNVASLKSHLKRLNIPVLSEDTGSNFGRWLFFDLSSGQLQIIKRKRDVDTA